MKKARMAIYLAGVVVVALSVSVSANISYPNFRSPNGMQFVGSASNYDSWGNELGRIRLTSSGYQYKAGSAWYATKQPIKNGFSTTFQFQITDVWSYPADGFAFVIQNQSPTALGVYAGALGYGGYNPTDGSGISNSLAIEFDTFYNEGADPSGNHISIQTRGSLPNNQDPAYSLACTSNIPQMANGSVYTVRVDYTPGMLKIYLNDEAVLGAAVNLGSTLNLDNGQAWVGFTGGTGWYFENQDILNWSYVSTPEPATMLLLSVGGLVFRRRHRG